MQQILLVHTTKRNTNEIREYQEISTKSVLFSLFIGNSKTELECRLKFDYSREKKNNISRFKGKLYVEIFKANQKASYQHQIKIQHEHVNSFFR